MSKELRTWIGFISMDFSSIEALKQAGFEGFKSFADLRATRCSEIPLKMGVYMVLREIQLPPVFLATSPVGANTKRKRDPILPDALQARWLEKALVVYIGKAGGSSNKATLRSRIRQYVDTGTGNSASHFGGRAVWQLETCWDLLVCWQSVQGIEPSAKEDELLRRFAKEYGKRPFANAKGGE